MMIIDSQLINGDKYLNYIAVGCRYEVARASNVSALYSSTSNNYNTQALLYKFSVTPMSMLITSHINHLNIQEYTEYFRAYTDLRNKCASQ